MSFGNWFSAFYHWGWMFLGDTILQVAPEKKDARTISFAPTGFSPIKMNAVANSNASRFMILANQPINDKRVIETTYKLWSIYLPAFSSARHLAFHGKQSQLKVTRFFSSFQSAMTSMHHRPWDDWDTYWGPSQAEWLFRTSFPLHFLRNIPAIALRRVRAPAKDLSLNPNREIGSLEKTL